MNSNHMVSMAFISVSSSLSGTTTAACHLVHLSSMWNIMYFRMNIKSHSTCWLKVSGSSRLHELLGPGLAQVRQTLHVCTVLGMRSNTFCDTPTRSRKRFITCSEACHHLTCNFRRVRRMAPSLLVLKRRTTFPMSKSVQSCGFSGPVP